MQALSPIQQQAINCIRFLSVEAIQNANSGHPGLPLGFAPTAYRLFTEHMRHNPADPKWPARDRFVLSAGHGSALLYSLLHLSGYDLSLEEVKNFRQLGSKTPGHPEYGHTDGVELTTGPLGQGLANAVGMAIAQKHLAARYAKTGFEKLFDYKIYVVAGDGCMQEGVAAEAASLAGHLGLDNLIVLYDDNQITIDGRTDLSFTEDVMARYEAYGWHTQEIGGDGHDLHSLDVSLEATAQKKGRPHLIKIQTIIGYGSPKADTSGAHGSPLGPEGIEEARKALSWSEDSFCVPAEVKEHFAAAALKGAKAQEEYKSLWAEYKTQYPELAQELEVARSGKLPEVDLPQFEAGQSIATRAASGKVLAAIMPQMPTMMGGSADLSPSNNTRWPEAQDFQKDSPEGRYLRFGVREHAMGAITNGINISGELRAYCATFLAFADYMLPSVRVASLSGYKSIFVFTHDSIGVGEDGPTHQPVEQVTYLRNLPGLTSFRPADANEVAQTWKYALNAEGPVAMSLTRQGLEVLDRNQYASAEGVLKGAYVLAAGESPKVTLLASGSEVGVALKAYQALAEAGISAQLVSIPSAELFDRQPQDYRDQVLLPQLPCVAVEAGIEAGLAKYLNRSDRFVGMKGFGASGPGGQLFEHFGITAEAVTQAAKDLLA